ncbi:MAG: CHAT domain-containing protein [Gloeomargarita sp. SKYG98]|nr:CHAT domain-containing protein [Gloeomargarita sp. SKYG98]
MHRRLLPLAAWGLLSVGIAVVPTVPSWAQLSELQEARRLQQQVVKLQEQGRYTEALPLLKRSLTIQEKVLGPEHLAVAESWFELAELYQNLGDFTAAELAYQRSLAIAEKALGPEHPALAEILDSLAGLYEAQQAEPLLRRSLAIREKALGPEHLQVSESLIRLAQLYKEQGNYAEAERLLRRSLAIREKALGPDNPLVTGILGELADLYKRQGNYTDAERLLRRSLAIGEKVLGPEDPLFVVAARHRLAELYKERRNYGAAESLYRENLAILEKTLGPEHLLVAINLDGLAELFKEQGNYTEAKRLLQRSLPIWEKALGPESRFLVVFLTNLAELYWAQGQPAQALPLYQRSADLEETFLTRNLIRGDESAKRDFLAALWPRTDAVVSLHLQALPQERQAVRLALTTLLQRKGRVLDALSAVYQSLRQRLGPQEQALFDQLVAVRSQMARLAAAKDSPPPVALLKQLTAQDQQLEAELSRRSREFAQAQAPVTLAAVQQAIPAQGALVELVVYRPFNPKAKSDDEAFGAARYGVYVLRAKGDPGWADLGPAGEIDALVERYRRALLDVRRGGGELQGAARALDARVMAPVRRLVGDATHLLIAPDGQLNLVPFGALVDEQGRYMLERYLITYLTSGRDLLRLGAPAVPSAPPLVVADPAYDRPGQGPAVQLAGLVRGQPRAAALGRLVFGPLPGTAQEAAQIAPLLPQARALTGVQATETAVKASPNARVLHLATHGFFLRAGGGGLDHPLLRSGLALAGFNLRQSGPDDGVLTALEVTGLDLRGTQLVVLSACETGLGDVAAGEGVYGLRRALVLAGAQAQVMSLWKVDDQATQELMVGFYRRLAQGVGRGEALRQAQLAMLQSSRKEPYYWAGFVVAGDWRGMR